MNSKLKNNDDLAEFAELIKELESADTRPFAPPLAEDYKIGLRHKLLQEHDDHRLSWSEMFNLWRFAATAVVVLLIMAAVILFWATVSNPSTTVGPAQDVVSWSNNPIDAIWGIKPENLTTRLNPQTSVNANLTDVFFDDGIQLNGYALQENLDNLQLTLYWQLQDILNEDHQLFIHVLDRDGNLIVQADSEFSRAINGYFEETYSLPLPPEIPDGRYKIIIGLYDSQGARIPVTVSNERRLVENGTAVYLTEWDFDAMESVTLPANQIKDLVLYDSPGGDPLDMTLAENIELILPTGSDHRILYVNNNVGWANIYWQNMQTGESDVSWVPEETYNRLIQFDDDGSVWLISARQRARPSANDSVTFDITLGLTVPGIQEPIMKVFYADPDWSTQEDGRIPLDGMTNFMPVTSGDNEATFSFTFSGNPAEMIQIVGVNRPVLVVQIGQLTAGENGLVFNAEIVETFSDFPFDLTIKEEISYEE